MLTGGFILHMILKSNLSVAVVDMTQNSIQTNGTAIPLNKFNWTISERNYLVGIMAWGYSLAEIPMALVTNKIGPKRAFGSSTFLACICTILFPWACSIHYYCILFIRFLLGLSLGGAIASWAPFGNKWFSLSGQCIFASILSTTALGVSISMSISGYIISLWGWEYVFYITGAIGFIWVFLWFFLVYNTPEEHPRIKQKEKMKILQEIQIRKEINWNKPKNIPWIKLFTCTKLWAVWITQISVEFTFFTFLSQMPAYLNDILHFDINSNGILSCLPFLGTHSLIYFIHYKLAHFTGFR